MKASVVDLRYRMKDLLKALRRRETVKVLHRGKLRGTIVPAGRSVRTKVKDRGQVAQPVARSDNGRRNL